MVGINSMVYIVCDAPPKIRTRELKINVVAMKNISAYFGDGEYCNYPTVHILYNAQSIYENAGILPFHPGLAFGNRWHLSIHWTKRINQISFEKNFSSLVLKIEKCELECELEFTNFVYIYIYLWWRDNSCQEFCVSHEDQLHKWRSKPMPIH
jgi:hypothetical protein